MIANTPITQKDGVGLTILEDNISESELSIYDDDGSSIVTSINDDNINNRRKGANANTELFLSDDGVTFAKQFAEQMRHHMNANETKRAFTKIREAFEGRYSKKIDKDNMIAGATLASLLISTERDWCFDITQGRLIPYLLSFAKMENMDNSPGNTNTRFQRFTSACSIYTLLNIGYVNKCINNLLLSNVVTKFCEYILDDKSIKHNLNDKEATWLCTFCRYGKEENEVNHIAVSKEVDIAGIRPTAINVIAMDVMKSISKCTVRWPSQLARFRFFLAGGFEALLIGATNDIKYKNNPQLREKCLECLKNYPLYDLLRFRSHCFYRKKPDNKVTQLYKLLVEEKREHDVIQNRKLELYQKAREDRDNKSLNLGTRLRAAKIRASVEVNGTVDLLDLPETKSKVILPCINEFNTGYVLPTTRFNQIQNKDEMFTLLKTRELQTARSNAARASADAYCIELKQYLTFEKEYRKRVQYENELHISQLLSDSHHRRSTIEVAREKTMQALDAAMQFKFDKLGKMNNDDDGGSQLAAHDHVRNAIKQADLNTKHCEQGVITANILLQCVNDEINFMKNCANAEKKTELENAQMNAVYISRQYNYLKAESANTRVLVVENEHLINALKEELTKAKAEGRSNPKQDAQNNIVMLNHNNYLIEIKHQLNKAVKEMKQLKPLLLQSNQELEMLQKKNILDFFTSEEKEVWEILQFNKIIAEVTVVAAEASLEEAKYVSQAENYKGKLFSNSNHRNDEIEYLLSKYTNLLGLARIEGAKAGTAYGTIRHVRHVASLKKGKKEDVKTVQSKSDIQKYAAQALLQSLENHIKDLDSMPTGYAANIIFHQWNEDQHLILQNEKKIVELTYNIALCEGSLAEAKYRLKIYKEKLRNLHDEHNEHPHIDDEGEQTHLLENEKAQLSSLKGKAYVLAWELAFHRRHLACERYDQSLSIAMKKRVNLADVEHATREDKRIIFDVRKKSRIRRICDEDCANATHDKTEYESTKPFETWKILGINNTRSIIWKGADNHAIERMKDFFKRSTEANHMAHDCVFAIEDLEKESKELHQQARTSKTGVPSPYIKEQMRSNDEKLKIFYHKLDRANWLYDMYHQLLKAQSNISHCRQTIEKIGSGKSGITKASVRRKKKEEAEATIAKNEVVVIHLNSDIGDYLEESNSKDEAKLRAELERLRIARLVEKEKQEKELAREKQKRLDAIEGKRHKEMMAIEAKRKKEEAKALKKKKKQEKKREKERQKALMEKKKHDDLERFKELEREKEHIKKMRHQQKLQKMKQDSQRALEKVETHKQGQDVSKKIMKYVLSRVDTNIERIEAKKREERKAKITHQKKMLRECKLWTEEYDENLGRVYYLNYRTHKKSYKIPECWEFKEQYEAEKYEKEQAEWENTNGAYDEGQEYNNEYDQQYNQEEYYDETQQEYGGEYVDESQYYEGQDDGQTYYGDY